jgi:uncharacterized OB-fold protein
MMAEQRNPEPISEATPYWDAAREHRLVLPTCDDCGKPHFYPRPLCPFCGSTSLTWKEASGKGTVYSFTIVHRPPNASFAAEVPYVVAMVALEEGPHLLSRIVNRAPADVRIGMPVRGSFLDRPDGRSLPVFEIAAEA